jgi:N-methylhydantoinase A
MGFRIGVDVGGTFTDFVLVDDASGAVSTHKQLTTPLDPSEAVIAGVCHIVEAVGITLKDVSAIVHGTTLVTNAVIERRGGRTGMLVTKGFSDSLDIGRESRYDLYDLKLAYPGALVPRACRIEVTERVHYDGSVVVPLDADAAIAEVARLIEQEKIEAVAICLLHSYVNPAHERALRDRLVAHFPDLHLSLSSEGYPVIREYERWTTTTLNAYVQPLVDRYLRRLEEQLVELGFAGKLLIMSSSGGTLTPQSARQFPSRLLESGPAAGVLMSAHHGRNLGIDHLLAFDMGGTTAKGAFVVDGTPLKKYELETGRVHNFKQGSGLVVNLPVIDMIEIGAGGGSIAAVDERGLMRVGPRSAGAMPGPAAYGRGGTDPTLTDANFVLGYLNPAFFLGGRMAIEVDRAAAAIDRGVGRSLDLGCARAAWGIHEIINEDVASAFRTHASERGIDCRSCSMVAFGGSGPLHALRVARKLRIGRVVLPPAAGVMSAFGMLVSPLSFEVVRSTRVPLADLDRQTWEDVFESLQQEASGVLVDAGVPANEIAVRAMVDMRYAGQGYEIEVPADLASAEDPQQAMAERFATHYRRQFGLVLDGKPVEIATWRLEASGRPPGSAAFRVTAFQPGTAVRRGERLAYDPDTGDYVPHAVYDRYAMAPGTTIEGPALVEELEATTVIGAGVTARVDAASNLIADLRSAA